MNNLKIEAYSSGTTKIYPTYELKNAQGENHSTGYTGGLYLDASFRIHRDILEQWALEGAQRVVIRNGLVVVYEGYVNNLARALESSAQYIDVNLMGAWQKIMMSRRWRKWWADDRVDESVWDWDTTAAASELCTIDRNNRLLFIPKAEDWGAGDQAGIKCYTPKGEPFYRVTFDYDFAEGGQTWQGILYNDDDAASEWSIVATGAGSEDITLGATTEELTFIFKAVGAQTAKADGSYYLEITNLVCYGNEAAVDSVDLTQICKDIVSNFTDINSSTTLIDTITYNDEIIPFVQDSFPTLADIVMEAAGYGDDSQDAWAVGLRHSESVASPDGKPVMFAEVQPSLTNYDYAVTIDEAEAPFTIDENYDELHNWIVVQYTDDMGHVNYVTPDDDANLKDTTSITDYGQRDHLLNVGEAVVGSATDYGRRYLAQRKDPQWRLNQPITVKGSIRKKDKSRLPASQIIAGKRIKVENWLNDLSGTGLTFLISHTQYNDDSETCAISSGPLEAPIIPYFAHPIEIPPYPDWEGSGYTKEEWNDLSQIERNRVRK